jgi:hypothetical protein
VAVGQLDEVDQGVGLEEDRELVACRAPVGHAGRHAQEHLEASHNLVGRLAQVLMGDCKIRRMRSETKGNDFEEAVVAM